MGVILFIFVNMKNHKEPLFAIFRGKLHLGNTRAVSKETAIYSYLIDAGYPQQELLDVNILIKYKAILAKRGLHF